MRSELARVQQLLAVDHTNTQLVQLVKEVRDQLIHWSKAADSYMAQKAKDDWILSGDKNTAYFQIVMRKRRYRTSIYSIQTSTGELVHDQEWVAACFTEFYTKLLGQRERRIGRVEKSVVELGA